MTKEQAVNTAKAFYTEVFREQTTTNTIVIDKLADLLAATHAAGYDGGYEEGLRDAAVVEAVEGQTP